MYQVNSKHKLITIISKQILGLREAYRRKESSNIKIHSVTLSAQAPHSTSVSLAFYGPHCPVSRIPLSPAFVLHTSHPISLAWRRAILHSDPTLDSTVKLEGASPCTARSSTLRSTAVDRLDYGSYRHRREAHLLEVRCCCW